MILPSSTAVKIVNKMGPKTDPCGGFMPNMEYNNYM